MRSSTRRAVLAVLAGFGILFAGAAMAQEDTYKAGMNYFKSGKYVEAAAEFQALVDEAPAYDYGYFMLGYCYTKLGKTEQAVQNFKEAIKINGERFEYHNGLAGAYMKSRQYRMAVETLNSAESILPEKYSANFYTTRGKAYYALKKWNEAISDLEKAKNLKPTASVFSSLGVAYTNVGRDAKAVAAYQAALKKDPKQTRNYKRLADALMNVGAREKNSASKLATYKEALEAAKQYLAAKPGDLTAVDLVGLSALGAHDYDTALNSFQQELKAKPDNFLAMMNLASAQIAKENWKAAEGTLQKAITLKPKNALARSNLGFVLLKQRRLDESLKSYEMAYNIKPSPGIKKALENVKTNIEVRDTNRKADEIEKENARKKAEAEKAYQEQLKKQKEWEKAKED